MTDKKLKFQKGVTLLGGGEWTADQLARALKIAPNLVCADGAANGLLNCGPRPAAIIGDLDSLSDTPEWRRRLGHNLIHIAEQDSTDFEKCLSMVDAPFFVGVGFIGQRQDHTLAALHSLTADPRPVMLLGASDVCFAADGELSLVLPVGARFSIFPMRAIRTSGGAGLKWPLDGLEMEAGSQIGTSNEVASPNVSVKFDRSGAVIFLDPDQLEAALDARRLVSAVDMTE